MSRKFTLYSKEDDYKKEINPPIKVSGKLPPPIKVYFSLNKSCKKIHLIVNHRLFPNTKTQMNLKLFNELYLKQLESIMEYEDDDDTEALLELLTIYRNINKNNYPIRIVTGNYKKLLPKICYVFNKFYNKHLSSIDSIYTTFNGVTDSENEKINQTSFVDKPPLEDSSLEPLKDDDIIYS